MNKNIFSIFITLSIFLINIDQTITTAPSIQFSKKLEKVKKKIKNSLFYVSLKYFSNPFNAMLLVELI